MAENTEIGKAYLNIVPSMDGFAARLSQLVNQQSGNAGDQAGEQLGSNLVSTLTKYLSAVAVGDTIRRAFLEGADLQQSIGGVDTLFKDNADQIKEYAYDAFKTAGLSANEYMTQATSTSAALIKSLSGDTQKAAELTQISITDMSDNVNKFGGDVESLQRAYQGFSRDNFTMLDNLRLGYAGNREGMEQLLADAEKLSGIHYDISSYADMIEAIHVIQDNLDITGTTAREASETFSGSFNAMQSAAKNLGGVLTAGGDVGKAVKDLEDTSLTFGKNVLNMIGNIEDGLGTTGKVIEVVGAAAVGYIGAVKLESIISSIVALNTKLMASQSILETLNINPIMLAISAAAAGGIALNNAIRSATDELDEIPDRFAGLDESTKAFVAGIDEISAATRANAEQRRQYIAQIDQEEEYTSDLINTIYELAGSEEQDAKSKAQLKALIDEVNEKYPELNLQIDKNTSELNRSKKAVEALTTAEANNQKVAQARENIGKATEEARKATEKATEAETKYKEAQNKRNDLQDKLTKAQKEYSDLLVKDNQSAAEQARAIELETEIIPTLKQEIDNAANSVGELSAAYLSAKNSANALNGEVENYSTILAEADAKAESAEKMQKYLEDRQNAIKAVTNELKDYVIAVGDSTYNVSSETYDKIKTISDGYAELVQNQENVILGSLDLFNQFSAGTDISFAELDSNLASNQQALIEWRNGIEKLEGTGGISEGLINELKSMGVGSLAQVRALANATPAELKRYSDAWDYTYEIIHDTAEEQLEKTAEENAEQIRNLVSQTKKGRPKLSDAYAILAAAAPEGYGRNLSENTAEISRVTAEMVSRGIVQKLQEMNTDAYNSGWNTVIAAKQGMIDAAEDPFKLPDFTTNAFSTGSAFSGASSTSMMQSAGFNSAARSISAVPSSGKMEVKIVTPDGREVAEWLIDDIDELSAVKLQMGR